MARKLNNSRASGVRGRAGRRERRRRADQAQSARPVLESLETRQLLTVTVFLDFGFNFPVGGLVVTDAQMANPGVNGPSVFGAGHTLISLTTTFQNRAIDLNGDGTADAVDAQMFADQVIDVVQRTFEPYDILVVQTAANNINDVITSLAANGNGVGNRDAYCFVVGASPPPPNDAWGWAPVDGGNTVDNTCFCFADAMIAVLGASATGVGRTAAHEPGHTFGLVHTNASVIEGIGDLMAAPEPAPQPDLRDFGDQHITYRYALGLQGGGGTQNAYDVLANPAVVGLLGGGPAYVTGTGGHDRITITRMGPNDATVLVEAFNNAAMQPAQLIGTIGYNIDTTNGILVESGSNNDLIIIDADIMRNVEVRGGDELDTLQIVGSGMFTPTGAFDVVTYTATGPGAGVVDFGGLFAISFRELEPITLIPSVGSLTINVADNLAHTVVLQDDGVVNNGMSRITIDGGLEDITFATPNLLTVNTFGGNDQITLQPLDQTFTGEIHINSNSGDDTLLVDVAGTGLVVGPITYDGGGGRDTLTVSGTPTTAVDEVIYTFRPSPGQGRLEYEDAANTTIMLIDYANLEPVVDLVPAAALTVHGTNAPNAINYQAGSGGRGLVSVDGNEVIEFANKTTLVIDGEAGSDEINLNNPTTPPGLTGIIVTGSDPLASDRLIVNGTTVGDTITFTPTVVGAGTVQVGILPLVTFQNIEKLVIVGKGGDDVLMVNGTASSEQIVVTPGTARDSGGVRVGTLVPMEFLSLGTGGTLSIDAAGGADDVLVYLGTGADDRFEVSATGDIDLFGPAGQHVRVTPSNAELVKLSGLDGDDTVRMTGDASNEVFAITATGILVRVYTGPVTLNLDQVEQLDILAEGGDDQVNVGNLNGTAMRLVNINLGADFASDTVRVYGTAGPDVISIGASAGLVYVQGLWAEVRIASALPADDSLIVIGEEGDDTIKANDGVEATISITLYGGLGNDYLSADAAMFGGEGNDTLVSSWGNDIIDGGPGYDTLVATGDVNFVLSDTQLTGLGTDSLTSIEQANLTGGFGANTFDIGAFSGKVVIAGLHGSDTIDFSASPAGVRFDLDWLNYDQAVSAVGLLVHLLDPIENFVGSPFVDKILIDALMVPRSVDGNTPTIPNPAVIPPGDQLTVDGQREFVAVDRTVLGQPTADSGTVTAFGYAPITFTDIEKLAIVNSLGTTGFGGFGVSAYTSSVNYQTTTRKPRATAVGDFDGNGHLDVVAIGNRKFSMAAVFMGNGNGTLMSAATYTALKKRAFDVAVADVTGDGILDIITVGRGFTSKVAVAVLRGNGDGTFQAPVETPVVFKGRLVALAVGDIDGDGDTDVVLGGSRAVIALANDGAGNLAPGVAVISGGKKIRSVQLQDMDHDGDVDILAANYRKNSVSVFLNNGAGVFTLTSTIGLRPDSKKPTSLVIGDFDNDGHWDIAVSNNRRNAVSILLGAGDGTFTLQEQVRYHQKHFQSIAAGDFNSDGKTDLVMANNTKDIISVLLSNGNGTFSSPYDFAVGNVRPRQPAAISLGDFNNDGGIDIVLACTGTHDISLLLKNLVI